jgi:predicted DNA-binding transcriptional regulator AlpA
MPAKAMQSTLLAGSSPGPLVQPPVQLGLSRIASAAFIGVSVSLFDEMVKDGRMPPPHRANSRLVWSRVELEKAFAALPYAVFQGLPYAGVQEQGEQPKKKRVFA